VNPLRQLSPQKSLFPEETRADDLRIRFTQSDDTELETLILDFTQESDVLSRMMRKTMLTEWADGLLEMVKDDLDSAPLDNEDIDMAGV